MSIIPVIPYIDKIIIFNKVMKNLKIYKQRGCRKFPTTPFGHVFYRKLFQHFIQIFFRCFNITSENQCPVFIIKNQYSGISINPHFFEN